MQLDFLAKLAFGTDAIAIRDNEHPKHELRVNRRSTDFTVEGLKLAAQTSQYAGHDRVDSA